MSLVQDGKQKQMDTTKLTTEQEEEDMQRYLKKTEELTRGRKRGDDQG